MNDSIPISNLADATEHIASAQNPVVFVVDKGDVNICGPVLDGVFGYRVGDKEPNLAGMLRDFRDYESQQGRTPLVFVLEGVSIGPSTREPPATAWVVHATDHSAGDSILTSGQLCSRHCLHEHGLTYRSFGRQDLGEPPDYGDLINFAPIEQPGPELVVASKQHQRFCSVTDSYTPGMRFYFRVDSLMAHPSYIAFLGGHAVRGYMRLAEVEHCVVSASELDESVTWTPNTFTRAADSLFKKRISNQAVEATS